MRAVSRQADDGGADLRGPAERRQMTMMVIHGNRRLLREAAGTDLCSQVSPSGLDRCGRTSTSVTS